MFQLQLRIKGYWTNTVYHPMEEQKITRIMTSLQISNPEVEYRLIPISE